MQDNLSDYFSKEDELKIEIERKKIAKDDYNLRKAAGLPPIPDFLETALRMDIINDEQYKTIKNEQAELKSIKLDKTDILYKAALTQPDILIKDKNGVYWQDLGGDYGYAIYKWAIHPDVEIVKCDFDGTQAKSNDFKKVLDKSLRSIDCPFRPSIGDSYYE